MDQQVNIHVRKMNPDSSITGVQNVYKGYKAPPTNHSNGMYCPNCDSWTWKTTQHCVECPYDIWLHFELAAKEERKQILKRRSMILFAIAAIFFAIAYISINFISINFGIVLMVMSLLALKLGTDIEQAI